MKTSKFVSLILLACIVSFGCDLGTNENNNSNESIKLAKIDITNATNLFVTNSMSNSNGKSLTGRAVYDKNEFFKITESGYVEEVSYYDENGKQMSLTITPTVIYNAGDDYVIICFNSKTENYLVRKSDGAIFVIDDRPMDFYEYVNTRGSVPIDENGNIYFLSLYEKVVKLDVKDTTQVIKTEYSPSDENVSSFIIDKYGNMLYSTSSANRIKTVYGKIHNITGSNNFFSWTAPDSNFYFLIPNLDPTIKKAVIDSEYNVSTSEIGSLPTVIPGAQIIKTNHRVILVALGGGLVSEVYPSVSPITLPFSSTGSSMQTDCTANYYYILGTDNSSNQLFLKINLSDDTYETLSYTNIEILTFNVSNDDVITFSGLNMNNRKKVIAQISSNNILEILSEEDNDVVILKKIK